MDKNGRHWTIEQIAVKVMEDFGWAKKGVVAIYLRQTEYERDCHGTINKNLFGFSKREVTRGTELAIKIRAGNPLTEQDRQDIHKIAYTYRKQLALIANGGVPINGAPPPINTGTTSTQDHS